MMQTINILLVEDEDRLRELVKKYFIIEGYNVYEAGDGQIALEMWEKNSQHIDVIVLDIMIPKYDGWTVAKRIRENSEVPIILLTARSDESDKILGFEIGVDQYVTKPFSSKELLARVKGIVKKNNKSKVTHELREGDLTVNLKSYQIFYNDKEIELSPKEYDLLLYFMTNKDMALSRDMILNKVWGYDYFGDYRTVDTHVKRLRKKIGDAKKYITTVRGVGYRFEVKE